MTATPVKALPYPVGTDTPDVPRDIAALATKLEALMSATEDTAITDLNLLVQSGTFFLDAATNTPQAGSGWYVYVTRASATYIRQVVTLGYDGGGAQVWHRFMVNGTWYAWSSIGPRRASGSVAVTPPAANSGVSVAVTFPVGRFTAAPKVMTNAQGNGYAFSCAGAITAAGFSARFYNPTATTPSGTAVEWTASQE